MYASLPLPAPQVNQLPVWGVSSTTRDAEDTELVSSGALYLKEIGGHQLLSLEEELALGKAVEEGAAAHKRLQGEGDGLTESEREGLARRLEAGHAARQRLIESNLRLVMSVARKYTYRGMALEDLVQEGNIGLHRAVEKYEWRRGLRFSTYAHWWIRQAITRALVDHGRLIRLPCHVSHQLSNIRQAQQRLMNELGRQPTSAEVAEYLELPSQQIEELLIDSTTPLSLQAPFQEEDETCLADVVADRSSADVEESAIRADLSSQVEALLSNALSEQEAAVLRLHFGLGGNDPHTLQEISERLELTPRWVVKLEKQALRKLRQASLSSPLAEYAVS